VRYLDSAAVRAAIPLVEAIAALRAGLAKGAPPQPVRTSTAWTGGELLVMPAEAGDVAGVKLVTVGHGPVRVQGVYVLFDAATLTPLVVADAVALTLIRTAALSALATDLLAPAGASRLAVIGTGPQAREHVAAIRAVRPISSVSVIGRTPAKAAAFAASVFDVDLAALVRGAATPPAGRTLFKSVGFGLADLLVAQVGIRSIAR